MAPASPVTPRQRYVEGAAAVWRETEAGDTFPSLLLCLSNTPKIWRRRGGDSPPRLQVCGKITHLSPHLYSRWVLAPAGKWAELALKYKFGAEIQVYLPGRSSKKGNVMRHFDYISCCKGGGHFHALPASQSRRARKKSTRLFPLDCFRKNGF